MGVSSQNNSNTVYIHNTEIRIYSVGLLIGAAGVALRLELRAVSAEVERNLRESWQ